MDLIDYNEYWKPTVAVWFGPYTKSKWPSSSQYYLELDRMLGIDVCYKYQIRPPSQDFSLSDEMRNLLTMLQGPDRRTILKMYRIQHDLIKEPIK